MFYLISTYWFWMLLALVLGAVVGWLIFDRKMGWSRIALGLFLAGLAVAVLKLLPGAWGLWLETALLLFASYFLGGLLGAWARGQTSVTPAVSLAAAGGGAALAARSAAPAMRSQSYPGMKPVAMAAPADGGADDLTLIRGVGPANNAILHGLGVHTFRQIAAWSGEECKWVGHKIAFPGRVEREHWVDQAKLLANGGETDFSKSVKSGAIKMDASANAPMGEADINRMAADVKARRMAADATVRQALDKTASDKAAADAAIKLASDKAAAEASARHAADKAAADSAAKHAVDKAAADAAAKHAADKAAADAAAKHAADKAAADAAAKHAADKAAADAAAKHAADKAAADAAAKHAADKAAADAAAKHAADKAAADAAAKHAVDKAAADAAAKHAADKAAADAAARHAADKAAADAAAKNAASHPGARPAALAAATVGKGDDLKLIKGIGPKNEAILHSLGVWHFSQIAEWKAPEETWVGHHMAFPGRVEREHWVEQARLLGAGMDTEHSLGVKSGAIAVDAGSDAPLSAEDGARLKSALPEVAAAVADEGKFEGKRPLGLAKPRGGTGDDLKRIKGIGPQNEGRLHGLGIWHFDQIAAWNHDQVLWVGGYLAFPGRIDREDWISQAKVLASGAATEFSQRVAKGLVASSRDDGSQGQGNVVKPVVKG